MTQPQILVNHIHFTLPDGKPIFNDLTLAFSKQKTALIGKNGIGKSTLIKLITGELQPISGSINIIGNFAYLPQSPIIPENTTVAALLECEEKLFALQRIYAGSTDEQDFLIVNDEWDLAERIQKSLQLFGLAHIAYNRTINSLSGGETTRLLLAKAFLANADFLLFDEPTNHLDYSGKQQFYHAIQQWHGGLIVVSHDRALLNLMEQIIELTTLGAACYGGNYDAYEQQKTVEKVAIAQQLHDAKKLMQKTKDTIQASREKHQQKQSYGRKLKRSGSIDKLAANAKKGRSERTQSKLLIKQERLTQQAETQLQTAKEKLEADEKIHIDLPATKVPARKIIVDIKALHFSYPNIAHDIIRNFTLKIQGPERIALMGDNGSGKTTLIKLILQQLQPDSGKIHLGTDRIKYLDQNASILKPDLSVLENFLQLNPDSKEEEAYRDLAYFLFKNTTAQKLVKNLSGGEKLRALLACILMSNHPPQLLILDEPTNHLDINSINSIESALNHYEGALIVISHDPIFLDKIGINKIISTPLVNY